MSENTMTPATNNFREFNTGNEVEPKVPIRFIGSATPISDFLQLYDNRKTRENYRLAISAYLRCFNPGTFKQPHEIDPHAVVYLRELMGGRNYHHDLRMAGNIFSRNYAPMTANLYLKATCVWLEDSGFPLSRRERSRIFVSLPPARAATQEIELKRRVFQEMYFELPEHIGVLLLTLTGSGMRLGEATKLLKTDLDETQSRTAVNIRAETTKTKTARTTYLTQEATDALDDYFAPSHRLLPSIISEKLPISSDTVTLTQQQNAVSSTGI